MMKKTVMGASLVAGYSAAACDLSGQSACAKTMTEEATKLRQTATTMDPVAKCKAANDIITEATECIYRVISGTGCTIAPGLQLLMDSELASVGCSKPTAGGDNGGGLMPTIPPECSFLGEIRECQSASSTDGAPDLSTICKCMTKVPDEAGVKACVDKMQAMGAGEEDSKKMLNGFEELKNMCRGTSPCDMIPAEAKCAVEAMKGLCEGACSEIADFKEEMAPACTMLNMIGDCAAPGTGRRLQELQSQFLGKLSSMESRGRFLQAMDLEGDEVVGESEEPEEILDFVDILSNEDMHVFCRPGGCAKSMMESMKKALSCMPAEAAPSMPSDAQISAMVNLACTKNAEGNFCMKLISKLENEEESETSGPTERQCAIGRSLGCCLNSFRQMAGAEGDLKEMADFDAGMKFCGVDKLPAPCPGPGESITIIKTGFDICGVKDTLKENPEFAKKLVEELAKKMDLRVTEILVRFRNSVKEGCITADVTIAPEDASVVTSVESKAQETVKSFNPAAAVPIGEVAPNQNVTVGDVVTPTKDVQTNDAGDFEIKEEDANTASSMALFSFSALASALLF